MATKKVYENGKWVDKESSTGYQGKSWNYRKTPGQAARHSTALKSFGTKSKSPSLWSRFTGMFKGSGAVPNMLVLRDMAGVTAAAETTGQLKVGDATLFRDDTKEANWQVKQTAEADIPVPVRTGYLVNALVKESLHGMTAPSQAYKMPDIDLNGGSGKAKLRPKKKPKDPGVNYKMSHTERVLMGIMANQTSPSALMHAIYLQNAGNS